MIFNEDIKEISALEVLIITFLIVLGYCNRNVIAEVIPPSNQVPIKVDVLIYDFNDKYISLVRQNFEEIQRNNQGKVEFTFYDGMNNQSIQNRDINASLRQGDTNLILLNIVDASNVKPVIDRIKEKGIPVILFNREPLNMEDVKSYNKAFFVGTNSAEVTYNMGLNLVERRDPLDGIPYEFDNTGVAVRIPYRPYIV